MVNQSKFNNTTDNQSKYGNKVPYNNVQPSISEELAPILVTAEIRKGPSVCCKLKLPGIGNKNP